MATIEPFLRRIKPCLEQVLTNPTKQNIKTLKEELLKFDFGIKLQIFNTHLLQPLVLKIDELGRYVIIC